MYNAIGAWGALWAVMAIVTVICVLVGLVFYVLLALGLMTLAKNKGIENPWLAWIPIADFYILGQLIKKLKVFNYDVPSVPLVVTLAPVALAVLSWIPVLGWLLYIAFAIFMYFVYERLFSMYRPQNAQAWAIVSAILPFMGAIFIFIIRNDRQVQE